MKYWIIKRGRENQLSEAYSQNRPYIFTIRRKGNVGINRSHKVIFLLENSRSFRFRFHGEVMKKEVEKESPEAERNYIFEIKLNGELEDLNRLEDYAYSLKFVRNFKDPIKGIRGPYKEISEIEFDGIKTGEFFVARTIIGHLCSDLHPKLVTAFIQYMNRKEARFLRKKKSHIQILEELRLFLLDRLVAPANQFLEATNLFTNLFPEKSLDSLRFQDPAVQNENKAMNAQEQVNAINAFLDNEFMQTSGFRENEDWDKGIDRLAEGFTIQSKYNKLFRSAPLPF